LDNNSIEGVKEAGADYFIFGATGDLANRKLFPALYSMYHEGKLADNFAIIGLSPEKMSHDKFCGNLYQSIQEFGHYKPISNEQEWKKFVVHIEYISLDVNEISDFLLLKQAAMQLERKFNIAGNRLFYLALPPALFNKVTSNIKEGGLLESNGWHRLVIEKPFGSDLLSAQKLNQDIRNVFADHEIFRLDHYLGKEMVQNINIFRFTNAFIESVWNNKYIANIQITMSETGGIGERGGYYDHAGALRDMGQNHMLQMLAMLAMEPPGRLHPEDIHIEKEKVFRALRILSTTEDVNKHVVRGQYTAGELGREQKLAYRAEKSVAANSDTETFFAAKLFVDNFRWAGVPFYIRTGKRLPVKTTEIVIEFKNVPDHIYFAKEYSLMPNLLVFRVSPLFI
jgi:glucose-6-phosphate 1-dehydrogenase